MFIKRIANFMH